MSNKQLSLLFFITMLLFTVGSGVMSLIALFAQSLGTSPSEIGFSLAIAFVAISISTFGSAWLSNHFQSRKKFIILAAALSIPTAYMLGQSQNIQQLTLWISILWFLFGIISTMLNIITGLFADEKHRGKTFGMLGAAVALAQFISGLSAGRIVDQWGYPALFIAASGLYATLALFALLLEDKKIKHTGKAKKITTTATRDNNLILLMLMIASVMVMAVAFMTSNMARPMMMELQNFSPTDITSVVAISGIVSFPIPIVMGWLSDRIGRRSTLIICYLLPTLGVAMLLPATILWQYWIAQSFIEANKGINTVASAFITDIVPLQDLSDSLARYNATTWIGAVVGFTTTGILIQNLGLTWTMVLGFALLLIAIPVVAYATREKPDKYATVLVGAVGD